MSTSIYNTVKTQGGTPAAIAAAKTALLAITPAVTERLDQAHAIMGFTRATHDNVFWFASVKTGADAQAAIADVRAKFYGYLVSRSIPFDVLNGFEIKAVAQTAEEVAENKKFLDELAELTDEQKFMNFVDFVGKRDLTPKYKSRGRK